MVLRMHKHHVDLSVVAARLFGEQGGLDVMRLEHRRLRLLDELLRAGEVALLGERERLVGLAACIARLRDQAKGDHLGGGLGRLVHVRGLSLGCALLSLMRVRVEDRPCAKLRQGRSKASQTLWPHPALTCFVMASTITKPHVNGGIGKIVHRLFRLHASGRLLPLRVKHVTRVLHSRRFSTVYGPFVSEIEIKFLVPCL